MANTTATTQTTIMNVDTFFAAMAKAAKGGEHGLSQRVLDKLREDRKLRDRWFNVFPGFAGKWHVDNVDKFRDSYVLDLTNVDTGLNMRMHGTILSNSLMYFDDFEDMRKDFATEYKELKTKLGNEYFNSFFLKSEDRSDASERTLFVHNFLKKFMSDGDDISISDHIVIHGAAVATCSFYPEYRKDAPKHPVIGNSRWFGYDALSAIHLKEEEARGVESPRRLAKNGVEDLFESSKKARKVLNKDLKNFDVINGDYFNPLHWFNTLVVSFE
jgi:hypothetical protein